MAVNARSRNKIFAILAGGLVLGVGTAVTLATWNDDEWTFGGNGTGGPGVGTSVFEVVQNVANPFVIGGTFDNHESNPGSSLTFKLSPTAMTPGDSIYAPIALTTTAPSMAGTLQLDAAVAAAGVTANDSTPSGALWDNLRLSIGWVSTAAGSAPPACDATNASMTGFAPIALTGTGLGAVPATATQALSSAGGNVLHYCFKITMPSVGDPLVDGVTIDQLQGRAVAPAWQFTGVSS